ncbi:hypothetical protein ABW19_dt0207689 [Dactylella cylindrospora]|nr:hypothetical protein ABW19_dt0207689 [Dactylella cylindrospora]
MPQTVLEGRVSKKPAARKSVPSDRALKKYVGCSKPADQLKEYSMELQYFYLSLGYTIGKAYESMEVAFRTGATENQYRSYVERSHAFKKTLTESEWREIARFYFSRKALGQEVAVRLNGNIYIDPQTVKRRVSRHISLTEATHMKQSKALIHCDSQTSFTMGSIEAYVPATSTVCQTIPPRILDCLPFHQAKAPLPGLSQRGGKFSDRTTLEIELISVGSKPVYYDIIEPIFFRLSNNLLKPQETSVFLDEAIASGYLSSLKDFLLVDAPSVQFAIESLIPVLIARRDEDMLLYVLGIRSARIHWFEMLIEIETDRSGDRSSAKARPPKYISSRRLLSEESKTRLIRFLAGQIEAGECRPSSITEEAALQRCAIYHGLISLDTLAKLSDPNSDLVEIEIEYERLYGQKLLYTDKILSTRQRMDLGLRYGIFAIAMRLIVRNDLKSFSLLEPYLGLNLPHETLEDLEIGQMVSGYFIWDILGKEIFNKILLEVFVETAVPRCTVANGQLGEWSSLLQGLRCEDLFEFALDWDGTELRDFLLDFFSTMYPQFAKDIVYFYLYDKDFGSTIIFSKPVPPWYSGMVRFVGPYRSSGRVTPLELAALQQTSNIFVQLIKRGADTSQLLERAKMSRGQRFSSGFELALLKHDSVQIAELWLGKYRDNVSETGSLEHGREISNDRSRWPGHIAVQDTAFQLIQRILEGTLISKYKFDETERTEFFDLFLRNIRGVGFRKFGETKKTESFDLLSRNITGVGFSWAFYTFFGPEDILITGITINMLQLISRIGNFELLKIFFGSYPERASKELTSYDQKTPSPLQCAVIGERIKHVQFLVEKGAVLHEQALCPVSTTLCDLWDQGPGYTALHYAVEKGNLEITKSLIEHGANLHALSVPEPGSKVQAETPVELAVRLKRLDFVALLLYIDIDGRGRALEAAKRECNRSMEQFIKRFWIDNQRDTVHPTVSQYVPEKLMPGKRRAEVVSVPDNTKRKKISVEKEDSLFY